MEPVEFEYANWTLRPSGQRYSDNVTGVDPLRVWTDGEQCVSCWRMSLKERLAALLFGRVWLALLSGRSQPPVSLVVARDYLQEVKEG
jgi:hypothetical protein